jgi:peroxiredoxin
MLSLALFVGIVAISCGDSSASEGAEMASDFSLPVANRSFDITLSDFQGDKHVVLVFYRGFF